MKKYLYILFLVFTISACEFHVKSGKEGEVSATSTQNLPPLKLTSSEQDHAIQVRTQFLKLVDAHQFDEAIALINPQVVKDMGELSWKMTFKTMQGISGDVVSRKPLEEKFVSKISDELPEANYFATIFKTQYQKRELAEQIVLRLDDGKWTVVGYHLEKK